MKKISFFVAISGEILQKQLALPDDAEKLCLSVNLVNDRFLIKEIKITKYLNKKVNAEQIHATYSFDRYVRSIKEIKHELKKQHVLMESVKVFTLQYLESLNIFDIQDGVELEVDELEVVA